VDHRTFRNGAIYLLVYLTTVGNSISRCAEMFVCCAFVSAITLCEAVFGLFSSSCIFVMQVAYIHRYRYYSKTVLGRHKYIIIEFKLLLCSGKGKRYVCPSEGRVGKRGSVEV